MIYRNYTGSTHYSAVVQRARLHPQGPGIESGIGRIATRPLEFQKFEPLPENLRLSLGGRSTDGNRVKELRKKMARKIMFQELSILLNH